MIKTRFLTKFNGWLPTKFLVLILLLLNPVQARSLTYPVRHYTMNNGLPSLTIRVVFKDSRGLLWIGTDAGLCTFDGKTFKPVKLSENVNANQVWAISEDEFGNIWIGSYGDGIFVFDGKRFKKFTKKDGLTDNYIRTLTWSGKFKIMLAGTETGMNVFDSNEEISSVKLLFKSLIGLVTGFLETPGFCYVTTYALNNPLRFYPGENRIVSAADGGKRYPINSFSVYGSSSGDTIFSFNTTGIRIIGKNGIRDLKNMGQVFSVSEDREANYWIASWSFPDLPTEGGVFRYDGKTLRNFAKEFGINDLEVWTVFYDKQEDILWVGTLNEGLYMIHFGPIRVIKAYELGPGQTKINDIIADSGNVVWICGNKNLATVVNGTVSRYPDKSKMVQSFLDFWNYPLRETAFLHSPVAVSTLRMNQAQPVATDTIEFNFNRIYEIRRNELLVTSNLGLFHVSPDKGTARFVSFEGKWYEINVMGDTLIRSGWGYTYLYPHFMENEDDYLRNHKIPIEDRKFNKYGQPLDVSKIIKRGRQFWYSTWNSGLWMSEGMKLVNLTGSDSTISRNLNDVCFDSRNNIIFCSNTGVIYIAKFINNKLNIIHRISGNEGLTGNSVFWILADNMGYLWAGTNHGLNCINLEKLYSTGETDIRFLDEESGYFSLSSKKAVIDQSDNLWIAANDHVTVFDTRKFAMAQSPQRKLMLTAMEINHHQADSLLAGTKEHSGTVSFAGTPFRHFENNIIFNFNVLNFLNPGEDRYRYILDGYDENWNRWGEEGKAVYTNLPPGDYKLVVESKNISDNTQALPLIIEFRINRPWWQLWYIRMAGAALFILVGFSATTRYLELRKRKQIVKAETEKKIARLEMQALQAQMNPHFVFNCVAGIQYHILADKKDEVLAYLSDFSLVVRASLSNASLRMIPLEHELDFLSSYIRLEMRRFRDKFDYRIENFVKYDPNFVMIPPSLVQPFVENSIRHGFSRIDYPGLLSVTMEESEDKVLKCTITDNGAGRDNNKTEGTFSVEYDRPHSTIITDSRIKLFNGTDGLRKYRIIYTDLERNGRPCGLKVELFIPMEKGKQQ